MKDKKEIIRLCTSQGKAEEPWVELPNGVELKDWGKEEQIIYNQVCRQKGYHEFYMKAFDFLYANQIHGDYLEFGCHSVRTFRMALTEARRQNMDSMRFLAFDNFEGLPEPDQIDGVVSTYVKGALATSEEEFLRITNAHGIYTDKIRTFKGMYQDRLTHALQAELLQEGIKASLICVDCDLYESAVPVFAFIEPFIQEGTVLYINDYFVGYRGSPFSGVGKAFEEFKSFSSFTYAPHSSVGAFGFSFISCKKR